MINMKYINYILFTLPCLTFVIVNCHDTENDCLHSSYNISCILYIGTMKDHFFFIIFKDININNYCLYYVLYKTLSRTLIL